MGKAWTPAQRKKFKATQARMIADGTWGAGRSQKRYANKKTKAKRSKLKPGTSMIPLDLIPERFPPARRSSIKAVPAVRIIEAKIRLAEGIVEILKKVLS